LADQTATVTKQPESSATPTPVPYQALKFVSDLSLVGNCGRPMEGALAGDAAEQAEGLLVNMARGMRRNVAYLGPLKTGGVSSRSYRLYRCPGEVYDALRAPSASPTPAPK